LTDPGITAVNNRCVWSEEKNARRTEALAEALEELDGLSNEERDKLKKSIPDILADTPKSETAALRFKKPSSRLGRPAAQS